MIQRSFRYRLYPTPDQAETLTQFVGAVRFIYNLALEQRATFERRGRRFNLASQSREITELRREVDWLRAAPVCALQQPLRDLDKAFAAFFARRARYPTPRRKGQNDALRCPFSQVGVRTIGGRWAELRVPNLGWVKLRLTREMRGRPMCVTVSHRAGQWHASFVCEIEHEAKPSGLPAVGIDRGITNTIALSTGELLSTPAIDRLERLRKRTQRNMARGKMGSIRYRKKCRRLGRIAAKIANVRSDWRHRVTTDIAQRFGTAALENLQTANMMRGNRGLSRRIREQGWRAFESALAYKLEERGGTLVRVDPRYTSQQCSSCGTIDRRNRESQASFACRACGFAAHADTNAAVNILRRSAPGLPVEASALEAGTERTLRKAYEPKARGPKEM